MSDSSLPSDFDFRPMDPRDVPDVLKIIRLHDDDDYHNAQQTYRRGVDGQYLLTRSERVVGCTGARPIDGTERSFWLSWTYLHPDYQGQGLGRHMLEGVLDELRHREARKVFVNTSDYYDPLRGDIFRSAQEAYRAVGFVRELTHEHYYAPDESLITLGLRLQEPDFSRRSDPPDGLAPLLTDVDEIPETDDAYYIAWELTEGAGSTADDLEALVRKVRKWKGRVVFVGVPSDAPQVNRLFEEAGFDREGRLMDFYEDGVDEIHFRLDLV